MLSFTNQFIKYRILYLSYLIILMQQILIYKIIITYSQLTHLTNLLLLQQLMSFASELWDRSEIVIKHSQNRRKQLEQFITALTKRINAEETYAKILEEAARIIQKIPSGEESVSSLAFSSFKFNCVNRGIQSKIYAKSIKEQILYPLQQQLQTQNLQTKQMEKNYKKLEKEQNDLQLNVIKYKRKFQEDYKDKSQNLMTNEILLLSGKTPKQKRLKISAKSSQILKNLTQVQINYEQSVVQLNMYNKKYYAQIQNILSTFEQHQRDRLAKQQQNIIKMLVFQTSMMKNFQYDIVTITKQVQKAKQFDDIKDFVIKNHSGREKPFQKSPLIDKDSLTQSVIQIVNKTFEKRISLQNNKDFKKYIETRFTGETIQCSLFPQARLKQFDTVFHITSKAWKGQMLSGQQLSVLKKLFCEAIHRQAFMLYLRQYLLTVNIVMCKQGYQQILVILCELLDLCQTYHDVFIARKITNLTFSFYLNKQDQKKYLHQRLNSCKIYSSLDYWKASIFQSVQQELYLHSSNTFEEELQMREMSSILGQLALYCHQMILLGVSSKNVRHIMGWFCRLYNIPEDQNRDLAKTVSLSVKKFKQLFSLAQTTVSADSNPKSQKQIREIFQQLQEKNIGNQLEGNKMQRQIQNTESITKKEQSQNKQ